MRDATDVVETVQNLTDTNLRGATGLRGAEVACSQRCLETHLQQHGLDNLVDVADVHDLLKVA